MTETRLTEQSRHLETFGNLAVKAYRVNLGRVLKQLRMAKGISATKVAELTKVSGATVSRLENGQRALPNGWLDKFAEVVGVSGDTILNGSAVIDPELLNILVETPKLAEMLRNLNREGSLRGYVTAWRPYWEDPAPQALDRFCDLVSKVDQRNIETVYQGYMHTVHAHAIKDVSSKAYKAADDGEFSEAVKHLALLRRYEEAGKHKAFEARYDQTKNHILGKMRQAALKKAAKMKEATAAIVKG